MTDGKPDPLLRPLAEVIDREMLHPTYRYKTGRELARIYLEAIKAELAAATLREAAARLQPKDSSQ